MTLYRLKWPDASTAAVVVNHDGESIRSLTITGAKVRLAPLADIRKTADFDAGLSALARAQKAELIKRAA